MLPLLLVAAALGLAGSAHCVAMCGGILGALSAGVEPTLRKRPPVHVAYVLAYNAGRVLSYAALGGAMALASSRLTHTVAGAQAALRVLAGALTLGLGLYLAGLLPAFASIERLAAPLWRRVAPLAQRLLPVRTIGHALLLGAVWGWVPCGMVYTALALATAAADPVLGAATMAAFGLGTLPAMLLTGTLAGHAVAAGSKRGVRRASGALLAVLGAITVVTASPRWHAHGGGDTHVCGGHAR